MHPLLSSSLSPQQKHLSHSGVLPVLPEPPQPPPNPVEQLLLQALNGLQAPIAPPTQDVLEKQPVDHKQPQQAATTHRQRNATPDLPQGRHKRQTKTGFTALKNTVAKLLFFTLGFAVMKALLQPKAVEANKTPEKEVSLPFEPHDPEAEETAAPLAKAAEEVSSEEADSGDNAHTDTDDSHSPHMDA